VKTLAAWRSLLERLLEGITIILMVGLAAVVVVAIVYRTAGSALAWYDEVASVQLAWLTYYAAALAAIKRAHISVPGFVEGLKPRLRVPLVVASRVIVMGFFLLLAWQGYDVLLVLAGDTLISLPEISTQFTQSVIPIGAILFVLAELFNLPIVLREARGLEDPPA
jgi:TRAP-type C4-dicarboxylate transport system permease small subunit